MLRLEDYHGTELEPHLDALGALRIVVFREYPYLYEGDLQYEREYLRTYARSERSLLVLVLEGEDVVGATTCLPMADEGPEFQKPFVDGGRDLETICYFGESILLPEYRGQGLGKEFFRRRETQANRYGFGLTTFCAVNRPEDHPLRPPAYRALDSFWDTLGYKKNSSLQAEFLWKEIGEKDESPKSLAFWTKSWPTT